MFHIKVWFCVALVAVVSLLMWVVQPQLIDEVAREQDRLRPLIAGQRFESGLREFYISLDKRVVKFGRDSALYRAMDQIDYEAKDQLSRVDSYMKAGTELKKSFTAPNKFNKERERLFVIAKDGSLLYRSYNTDSMLFRKFALAQVDHLSDALRGRTRTGVWMINLLKKNADGKSTSVQETFSAFVAATPIYKKGKAGKGAQITGALLYALRIDDTALTTVMGLLGGKDRTKKLQEEAKSMLFLLFRADKTKGDEPSLAPLAYNTKDAKKRGIMRGWFKKKAYYDVADKYENGMNHERLKASVQKKDYTYTVANFPADLSMGRLGYVLMVPIPNRFLAMTKDTKELKKKFYQSGYPRILAAIAFGLAILFGFWLSGSEILYFRRVVPALQTAPQEGFPDIPVRGLSRPWRELADSTNRILSLIRERGLGNSDMQQNRFVEDEPSGGGLSYLAGSSDQLDSEDFKRKAGSLLGVSGSSSSEESSRTAPTPSPATQTPAAASSPLASATPASPSPAAPTSPAPVTPVSPSPAAPAPAPASSAAQVPAAQAPAAQAPAAQAPAAQAPAANSQLLAQQQAAFQQLLQQLMQQLNPQQQQLLQYILQQMNPQQQQQLLQMTPQQQVAQLQQLMQQWMMQQQQQQPE